MLVAAGFRAGSASGRLAAAVRAGRLVALWTEATRAEARSVIGRIPPLQSADVEALFPDSGRIDLPLDPSAFTAVPDVADRAFAALALAAGVPLVTADGPLVAGARAHGVTVVSAGDAARQWLG